MQDKIHIYPVDNKNRSSHCTDKSLMCGCKPKQMQVCAESNEDGKCKPSCVICSGSGLVKPYDDELNILVIHNDNYMK